MLLPRVGSVAVLSVLLHVAFAVGVAVEHLVYGVSRSLACSFSVVDGLQVERVVAQQGVAQHKHLVDLLVASCDQAAAPCRLSVALALNR